MSSSDADTTKIPKAFRDLFDPQFRDYAYHGGRGGAKSHSLAGALVAQAAASPIRVVCAREIQESLRDSVKQLIEDKIEAYGLGGHFEVLRDEVRGKNGSRFVFKGMWRNPDAIKSLEGADIFWGEEAKRFASGFSRLVHQLQEENTQHRAAIKDLQGEADKMRRGVTKLRSYAEALFRHIAVLEHQIVGLGAVPAPRPALPDTA